MDDARRGAVRDNRDEGRHRVVATRDELYPPDELGHGGSVLVADHRHHRAVVAEEELVFLLRAVASPMPPGGRRIGTRPVFVRRRAGEARDVGPVDRIRARGVLVASRHGSLDERVAQPLEEIRGRPVGRSFRSTAQRRSVV